MLQTEIPIHSHINTVPHTYKDNIEIKLQSTVYTVKCTEEGKAQIGHLLNLFSVIVAGWERSCKTVRVETGGVSVTGDDTD